MKLETVALLILGSLAAYLILFGSIHLMFCQPTIQPLPTITQIQQELVSRGHDIEVDGRLGPATQEAWDEETLKGIVYKNFESVIEADREARGL